VVFENIEHYHARINDPALDVDENSVLVLKNCGPRGYPGMAEVGNMGLPPKLLKAGVTDMVRISDARMSGTAYGTVVTALFAPKQRWEGPLALVQDGDVIELDVENRKLHLAVDDAELERRRKILATSKKPPSGGLCPPLLRSRHASQPRRRSRFLARLSRQCRWPAVALKENKTAVKATF